MTDIVDARRLVDMHALYRMFDERGRLLYIGITGDLGKRMGEHSFKRWFPLVETIRLEWLPTRAAALVAELRAISTERPRYNKAGLTPSEEMARKIADEEKRRTAEEKQRAIDERRRLLAEKKERAAKEQQRLLEEERRIAEEAARLLRELPPRDLLADLDAVMGDTRVKLRDVAALLRTLAPEWEPYRKMTAARLREELKSRGVRWINSSGTPWLDPADLRRVHRKAA